MLVSTLVHIMPSVVMYFHILPLPHFLNLFFIMLLLLLLILIKVSQLTSDNNIMGLDISTI